MSDLQAQEIFEWVELDHDYCTLTFGTSPCTAILSANGNQECFNTRQTCAVPSAFDLGSLTLKFCRSQAYMPDGGGWHPMLVDVTISGSSINPIGADSGKRILGTRGGLSVTLQDMPTTDSVVDKYLMNRIGRVPTYDPEKLGTFWTKWRARNPFYLGRKIRYKSAKIIDGVLQDIETRHFFVTGISGFTSDGRIQISARDIFSVYSDKNVKIPAVNSGKLLADTLVGATSFTLDPAGIGNEQYSASGYMCIGSDIFAFTRSGDSVTIGARYGSSEASAHSAGDVVQQCLYINAKRVKECMETVLIDGAKMPAEYLDTAQWNSEQTAYLPRSYTRMIAKPEGLEDCLGSMSMSMYFYPFWNDRENVMQIRAVRPAQDDTIYHISDVTWIESDSSSMSDEVDQLYTQTIVNYGQRDPTKGDEATNYSMREIFFTDGGEAEKNGIDRIMEIWAKWIPRLSSATAVELAEKFSARYSATPRRYNFIIPARGFENIWVGDFVQLDVWQSVDALGNRAPMNLQILSAQYTRSRDQIKLSGQEFVFEKPIDPSEKNLIIGDDVNNYNLYDAFLAEFGIAPSASDKIRLTIRAGVVVGSDDVDDPSLYIPATIPLGATIQIDNFGTIAGHGGHGWRSGYDIYTWPRLGCGGDAIRTARDISINNLGTIGGGGGGARLSDPSVSTKATGGGAGRNVGSGSGTVGVYFGADGSLLSGGGVSYNYPPAPLDPPIPSGYNAGGDLGEAGANSIESGGLKYCFAGNYLYREGVTPPTVTWINMGDVRGNNQVDFG